MSPPPPSSPQPSDPRPGASSLGTSRPRHLPAATYRLQIEPGQPLAAAAELVPYLHRLGVTDLYSSPLTEARRGSAHGYDVTDPTRVREEIGGEAGLRALAAVLATHRMGLVLDIVPNHMAASVENPWWRDVLTRGAASSRARFFDIDWESAAVGRGRVLLPVLGAPYGEELEGGALRIGRQGGEVVVRYHDLVLPVRTARDPEALGGDPDLVDPDLVDAILADQPYRLGLWRLASEIINYRRFFDISDLVGVRVEDEVVFAETHRLFLRLAREGIVTGLRIDHIDGLHDPREYLERLQAALAQDGGDGGAGAPFYVVVEKILAGEEDLPPEWPVAGTTGYDTLNSLTGLFVDPRGLAVLDRVYARYTGLTESFEEVRYQRKRQALEELFAGEVASLVDELASLAATDRHARDLPPSELRRVLLEVTACLPVYRTYVDDDGPSQQDRELLARALADARSRLAPRPLTAPAFAFLERVLAVDPPRAGEAGQEVAARWLHFTARWQQLTGPAMAKGLEDTALYVYNRLISLNAVGGEPEGIDPPGDAAAYHRRNTQRRARWPYAMTASSTHDAKRSEDVRARVNVLSELADGWRERVERWTAWNRGKKKSVHGRLVPDANEEIFLYQTLVGAWPLRDPEEARFAERLEAYLVKAAREAKVHTSWLEPDEDYEAALVAFVRALLDPGPNRFLDELLGFHELVAFYGAWGSLSQVVLQVASPGVPDFYQGTELWGFSLVDPDNRRPVDWELRRRLLDEMAAADGATADGGAADVEVTEDAAAQDEAVEAGAAGGGGRAALLAGLVDDWRDGRIKLWITWKALTARRAHRDLFLDGDYQPIEPSGPLARHCIAFARRHGEHWLLAAVPRWLTGVTEAGRPPVGEVWEGLSLPLPEGAPERWRCALSGEEVAARDGVLAGPELFARLPVALLLASGDEFA